MRPLSLIAVAVVFAVGIPAVKIFVNITSYIVFIILPISALVISLWIVAKLVDSRLGSPPVSGYGLIEVYPSPEHRPASSDPGDRERSIEYVLFTEQQDRAHPYETLTTT